MYRKARPNDPPWERDALAMSYNCLINEKHYFDLMNYDCSDSDEEDFVSILFEFYTVLAKGYDALIVVDYMEDFSFTNVEDAVIYRKKNIWEKKPPRARRKNEMLLCYWFDKYMVGFDDGLPKDSIYWQDTSYIWTKNVQYEWLYPIFMHRDDFSQHMHLFLFEAAEAFPDLEETMEKIKKEAFLCSFEMDHGSHYITETFVDANAFSKEALVEILRPIAERHERKFVLYDHSEKTSDDTYKG